MTLPDDVVRGLRTVHPDLAWAIVTLFEGHPPQSVDVAQRDVELVRVSERRSLIVVNRRAYTRLPGIQIIPLDNTRAFLAMDPGRGMADLELAVIDRLSESSVVGRERKALRSLHQQLRAWRRNRTLHCRTHAIIVVEQTATRTRSG